MKQLTYALWLQNNIDFSTHPGLINVITAAFNGIPHTNQRLSFTQYPAELEPDIRQLTELVTGSGFEINDKSFISKIQFGLVKTYVANIFLPQYGHDSFSRLIVYGAEAVAQQFDFSGDNFIGLTITVNSGGNIALTGSNPILRNWDPLNAIPLAYVAGKDDTWTVTIPMIPGETLEFKLVRADGEYEPGPNRVYKAGNEDGQLYIEL